MRSRIPLLPRTRTSKRRRLAVVLGYGRILRMPLSVWEGWSHDGPDRMRDSSGRPIRLGRFDLVAEGLSTLWPCQVSAQDLLSSSLSVTSTECCRVYKNAGS